MKMFVVDDFVETSDRSARNARCHQPIEEHLFCELDGQLTDPRVERSAVFDPA